MSSGKSSWETHHRGVDSMTTETGLIWPVLQHGITSADVRAAQYLLNCRGFETDVSGTFDDPTREAVLSFQAHVGVAETGKIDKDTWDYLTNEQSEVGFNHHTDRVDCVRAAQVELRKQKAEPNVDVTGDFDKDITAKAVMNFQHRVHGDEDGIVGPSTWANLVCRKPPS